MEFGPNLMELVSPCSTTVNQVIKTMHPQGTSASLSPKSHRPPPSLSNMHTNTNAAHNYSNQHPFSINISSGNPGQFTNQNQEQPPASNHPVTNTAAGQGYNLQKSNNTTSVPTSQINALSSVRPIANVAPQIAEPVPEKSQANGTSEGEPSQSSFTQSTFSLTSKDKPSPTAPQSMDVEPPSVQDKVIEASSLPVSTKTDNADSATSNPTSETSSVKSSPGASTPKEADSPTTGSYVPAQPENDKSPSVNTPEDEQDPLLLPEKEKTPAPEPVAESKTEVTKKEELKVEKKNSPKNLSTTDKVKSSASTNELAKEERTVQKEVPETKPVTPAKSTPRKAKTASSTEQELTPIGTSTPAASSSISTAKRQRIRTQHYQSPLPEVEFVSKISSTSMKNVDEKLIVFYKNEFLAVRNAEGGFYLCQAIQNIYKSSPKIKIRWLSQDKNIEKGEIYTPDFYDFIDFDCILTNLSLSKADKGKFLLPSSEKSRTESILNRSLAVEKGEEISSPSLTEEHPDGLDLSLYRDEDQLMKRKARKRNRKTSPAAAPKQTPVKKSPKAPKARKVVPPAKAVVVKKEAPKKTSQPIKKVAPAPETRPSVAKSSKTSGKTNNKTSTKTSPVVDQKKAKVLARIGRKTTVAKPSKNNSKNGKSGNKAVASSNKVVQPKASSNGSVKTTTRTSVRKSTRK